MGPQVAIQNSITKLWDIYGVVIDIGPHRRYYIKTTSGQVLVCNKKNLNNFKTEVATHLEFALLECSR